ncbi:ATP-binding cassette domain-containing protein [Proteobacteria bacterium 005FR1]|nr:ATP-binding cassette domain-containing protein [Proteobacteria bacterium 005FR1]
MQSGNTSAVLSLRGFGLAFGGRVVLSSVNLEVPASGVTSLMGPTGTGKTTLLRTLCGLNESNPNLLSWGLASYAGAPLGAGDRPSLVMQSARLLSSTILQNVLFELPERSGMTLHQQRDLAASLLEHADLPELVDRLQTPVTELPFYLNRLVSIVRVCATDPRMICLDEPTAGLKPDEADRIIDFVGTQSARRAVLSVMHNHRHAQALGGHTALLAGGVIQVADSTEDFFREPSTLVARTFVRTGSCSVPSPQTALRDLDHPARATPLPLAAQDYVSDSLGPNGFLWLKKGRLAGTPRPGVFYDTVYDLKALRRVGVTCLMSLTEHPPAEPAIETDLLRQFGINGLHYPIADMAAPSMETAVSICESLEDLLKRGEVVAVHCRAGLGRTGTVLAAQLIWEGSDAMTALETVRRIEPRWVQSDVQVAFLESFELFLANRNALALSASH